jgi:hypothetical protein
MSSTNNKCDGVIVPTILIPLVVPTLLASKINLLRHSVTKRNKKGDKGNPCLEHLDALKKLDCEPLIVTTKFVDSKQPIIQLED